MNARTAKLIRRTAKAFMAAIPDFKPVPRQLLPVPSTARDKKLQIGLDSKGEPIYVTFKTVTFVNHPQSERGLIRRMKRRGRLAQQRRVA